MARPAPLLLLPLAALLLAQLMPSPAAARFLPADAVRTQPPGPQKEPRQRQQQAEEAAKAVAAALSGVGPLALSALGPLARERRDAETQEMEPDSGRGGSGGSGGSAGSRFADMVKKMGQWVLRVAEGLADAIGCFGQSINRQKEAQRNAGGEAAAEDSSRLHGEAGLEAAAWHQ